MPAVTSTPPTLGGAAGEAEVGLHRALDPQHLLEEVGDLLPVVAELVLQLGVLGEVLERGGEQAGAWSPARPRRGRSTCAPPTVTSGMLPSG